MSTTETIDISTAGQDNRERKRARGGLWPATFLLFRRRLRRDAFLGAASAAIIATAVLIAFGGPALVSQTIDDGARDAVEAAGEGADLRVRMPVGNSQSSAFEEVAGVNPSEFDAVATTARGNLPASIGAQVTGTEAWVLSSAFPVTSVQRADDIAAAEEESTDDDQVVAESEPRGGDRLQFGMAVGADVTLVDGTMPTTPEFTTGTSDDGFGQVVTYDQPIEIALTAAASEALDLQLGDRATVQSPLGQRVVLELVGIVEPVEGDNPVWTRFPEFAEPVVFDNPAVPLLRRATVVVTPETLDGITSTLAIPFAGTALLDVTSDGMTLESSQRIARDLRGLDATALVPDINVPVSVDTTLAPALESYPARARAAMAQMSVVVAGVIAVAAVVIALMARLLIARREGDIALERARGASIASTGVRLLLESVLLTAIGYVGGYYGAVWLVGDVAAASGAAELVAIVSALAAPVLGVLFARRMWTGKREAANRQDRAKVRRGRAARRLSLEALAVVLGVLAVVTLRGRGVLQASTTGIDPFLAAAPVLMALAVVVIVIRLYPIPMALIQAIARRTRGVGGVIALAKARAPIPLLPLLALTLAIAVAVSSALMVATVRAGQEQASWERIGGQVRIDAEVDPLDLELLREQGLTVSENYWKVVTTLQIGDGYQEVNSISVDDNAAIVDDFGFADTSSFTALADAAAAWNPGDPIPALASQEILDLLFDQDSLAYMGRTYLPIEFIGTPSATPDGWTEGPYVFFPADLMLSAEVETPFAANLMFVSGDGAEDAVLSLPAIAPETVQTRAAWLAATRDSALVGGIGDLMALSVIVVGVLAGVALLVTVLQGVRERGRALSMLRTQGMSAGWGWWLALTELAPLTLAAVVGGAAAGFAIMALLGGALGLEVLAGGIAPPTLAADPLLLGLVAGGVAVLLLFAVAAEVTAHRRNKLSEVLRYGESR